MDRGDYFNCERVNLDEVEFTPELVARVPKELALRYQVVPVSADEHLLSIALSDPSDLDIIDALLFLLKKEVEPKIADEQQLRKYVHQLYGAP